jgi:hypothetical protein
VWCPRPVNKIRAATGTGPPTLVDLIAAKGR